MFGKKIRTAEAFIFQIPQQSYRLFRLSPSKFISCSLSEDSLKHSIYSSWVMQNSITEIEQNRPENHQKEQAAAGEIMAYVIVQPLLLRWRRFREDEKEIRSVESAGKIREKWMGWRWDGWCDGSDGEIGWIGVWVGWWERMDWC